MDLALDEDRANKADARSIAIVSEYVYRAAPRPPYRSGTHRPLIVLAVDGVTVSAAAGAWSCDELADLRTTFPSTTATAWLTAFTGAALEDHLVPGLVFHAPGARGLINVVETRRDDRWAAGLIPSVTTVFERLAAEGAKTLACLGALTQYPGPWRDALLRGATAIDSKRFAATAPDPRSAADATVADVDDALGLGVRDVAVVWAYADLDSAVHRRGYDGDVQAALGALDRAARRWADGGATVLAVSDHGLTPVRPAAGATRAWKLLEASPLCRCPSGGAGRVRWLYASPGRAREVFERASDLLGDLADVHEVAALGASAALGERLGDVLAIARDPAFPLPDGHGSWDHGATTADEMLVPFARWGAGDDGNRLTDLLTEAVHR